MIFLVALCWLWAGMVLGISFLEASVKFTAPSLTLAVGLDVGRQVFGAFNKVEIAAALLCTILCWRLSAPRFLWRPILVILSIVAVQTLWLLPVLDARVQIILDGRMPPQSSLHIIYIVLEVLKLVALLWAGRAALALIPPASHAVLHEQNAASVTQS